VVVAEDFAGVVVGDGDVVLAIVHWIEVVYHRRRRQQALGRLTPIEFEAIMTTQAASAA